MPPKKRTNNQPKATAAAPSAPLRMTRSRAASQGLELPTKFTTPPDKVRRSRKPSKSSQGSIPVIAETVEVEVLADEPIVISASDDEDEVGTHEAEVEEQPSSPLDQSIAHEGSIHTETSVIIRHHLPSPSPQPGPKSSHKRRRSSTYQSSASDSDADSEDNHAHVLTYAERPPPPRRRARGAFTRQNNPREEAARQIRISRIEDFNRQMKEQENKKQTSTPASKRIRRFSGPGEPSIQASHFFDTPVPEVPQSAPTTPAQRRGILAPLLNSASNMFSFWGSRSAAPRVQSQPVPPTEEAVAPSTENIPANSVNSPSNNRKQLAHDDHSTTPNPLKANVNDITASVNSPSNNREQLAYDDHSTTPNPIKANVNDITNSGVFSSPSTFKSSYRRSSRSNVRRNMQQRKRQASESSPTKPVSTQELSQDTQQTEMPPTKSRRLESSRFASSTNSQRRYQHEADEFEPESSPTRGNKRKLGKTFSMPEADSTSDSEANVSDGITLGSGIHLTSSPFNHTSEDQNPASVTTQNIFNQSKLNTPPAMPVIEHEPKVGRTYSMPDSTAISNSDVSVSELEFPNLKKPMKEWTSSDMKDYMKQEHDWDPEGLAAEVPDMLRGHLPSMFAKARAAIRLMKIKAEEELAVEMKAIREARLAQLDAEVQQRRQELEDLEIKVLRRSEDWQKLKEHLAYGSATEHQNYVQNGTPEKDTATGNIFNTSNEPWTQIPPSSPTPSHAQLPVTPNAKSNISWAENKTNHITSPGPNEPPKYSGAPLPTTKSALKGANGAAKSNNDPLASLAQLAQSEEARSSLTGRQLESYERKMSDLNKYTPKKPSRLREVSRLSSSPAVAGGRNAAAPDGLPAPNDTSISDITMHTLSDLAQSPGQSQIEIPSPPSSPPPYVPNPVARALAWEAIQNGTVIVPPLSEELIASVSTSHLIPPDELAFRKRNLVIALGLKWPVV